MLYNFNFALFTLPSLCCTLSDIHRNCLLAGAVISNTHVLQMHRTPKELVTLAVKILQAEWSLIQRKSTSCCSHKKFKSSQNVCKIFHSQTALAVAVENRRGQRSPLNWAETLSQCSSVLEVGIQSSDNSCTELGCFFAQGNLLQ